MNNSNPTSTIILPQIINQRIFIIDHLLVSHLELVILQFTMFTSLASTYINIIILNSILLTNINPMIHSVYLDMRLLYVTHLYFDHITVV